MQASAAMDLKERARFIGSRIVLRRGLNKMTHMNATDVGLVYDDLFLEHRAPAGHPEDGARLEAAVEGLRAEGLFERFHLLPSSPLSQEDAERVHQPAYLEWLAGEVASGATFLDVDTFLGPRSLDAARAAAGGCVALVRAVASGELGAGLALVRPPGHHAEANSSGGFCLLNNVALAAAAARDEGLRPAIFDFDVHHGNGTQWAFYDDPDVLVISIHGQGAHTYPGSGAAEERGGGAGEGANLNIPLPMGSGDDAYALAMEREARPAMERFNPDLLLVSAGFDAHRQDPLGGMDLTDDGFRFILEGAASWAREFCGGRWVAALEGGYHPGALSRGIVLLARCLLSG